MSTSSRFDRDGPRKPRLRLALALPLGGMITVGLVSVTLGFLLYNPPKRQDMTLDLPTLEEYETRRLEHQAGAALGMDAGPAIDMDAGPADASPPAH